MYVLVSYDAVDGRSDVFRKILSRYMVHELESVFAGDITESNLVRLKKEISRAMEPGDSLILVTAKNRNNVGVEKLSKAEKGGALESRPNDHHLDRAKVV